MQKQKSSTDITYIFSIDFTTYLVKIMARMEEFEYDIIVQTQSD